MMSSGRCSFVSVLAIIKIPGKTRPHSSLMAIPASLLFCFLAQLSGRQLGIFFATVGLARKYSLLNFSNPLCPVWKGWEMEFCFLEKNAALGIFLHLSAIVWIASGHQEIPASPYFFAWGEVGASEVQRWGSDKGLWDFFTPTYEEGYIQQSFNFSRHSLRAEEGN